MSHDNPQTWEEWKAFHFPSVVDTAPISSTPETPLMPEGEEDETEGSGGEGRSSGGGPAYHPPLEPASESDMTADVPVVSEKKVPSAPPLPAGEPEPEPLLPLPPAAHPSTWTYDPARGLIINWKDERMVSLPRHLNTLPMILRHLAIIESRDMDHLGFIQALNRACLDVHGKTLKDLIRSLPKGGQQPIGWGDLPSEKISLSQERRRRMGVR